MSFPTICRSNVQKYIPFLSPSKRIPCMRMTAIKYKFRNDTSCLRMLNNIGIKSHKHERNISMLAHYVELVPVSNHVKFVPLEHGWQGAEIEQPC